MTRINTIDPELLLDQHLLGEYYELPRIIKYFKKSLNSKKGIVGIPDSFTLNTGHVKFFYNKRKFLEHRLEEIRQELLLRGYKPNLDTVYDFSVLSTIDQVDYEPTDRDKVISAERIVKRFADKVDEFTYFRKPITVNEYLTIIDEEVGVLQP